MDYASPVSPHRTPVFMTTRWMLLAACSDTDQTVARQALEEICQAYWYPIYAVIRHSGHRPTDAQDLTQEFFLRMIKGRRIEYPDQSKGRFRAYLLTALKHFLLDGQRREWTFRRGWGYKFVSIDAAQAESLYALEPFTNVSPETLYEQKWAQTLIAHVFEQLQIELAAEGKAELFNCFKGVVFAEVGGAIYQETATRMNMPVANLQTAVSRLRRRLRALLREEVARTLSLTTESEIDVELRHLLHVAGNSTFEPIKAVSFGREPT